MTSLFRRVTKYARSDLDPRENRLTEAFAAVLERSDGLGAALVREWVGREVGESSRLWVRTQRATVGRRLVDLELAFGNATAPDLRVWVEIKHGADTHENQLESYVEDMKVETQGAGDVVLLAPRDSMPAAPDGVPRLEWQGVGRFMRDWRRSEAVSTRAQWLIEEFIAYLQEEGLMDGERLTAAQAFELEARPAAERTVARLMEIAQAHVVAAWGEPDKKAGGTNANFGQEWWASFPVASAGDQPAETWRKAWFDWTLRDDSFVAEPRDSLAFFAGATFEATKGSALSVPANGQWFAERSQDGFERAQAWYWRLWRVRYPDQLLSGNTLEDQGRELGEWIVDAFRTLANAPPPA